MRGVEETGRFQLFVIDCLENILNEIGSDIDIDEFFWIN